MFKTSHQVQAQLVLQFNQSKYPESRHLLIEGGGTG